MLGRTGHGERGDDREAEGERIEMVPEKPVRRWTARHRGWAAILAFAALALVAFFAYRTLFQAGSAGAVSYVTQAAETGTLVVSVTATGNVALGQTYDVAPAVTGVVRGLTAKVGDTVTKGQVLFTLENAQLDADVTSAKAGYSQAKASLYNAEAQVEQAEQSLEQLRVASESGSSTPTSTAPPATAPSTTHSPTSQPSATAPPATSPPSSLPATTAPAMTDPPATDPPGTDPSVALLRSSTQAQAVVVALASPARGTATATTASTGQQTAAVVTEDDIEIAEKQLAAAQASLTAARANLTNADFSLQRARETADKRTVTAPAPGKITVLSAQEGLSLGSSSASTSSSQASGTGTGTGAQSASSGGQSSQAAATIVDPRSISVVVQLNEVDIPQVKVDQKATLTFDALPDLTLTGAVTVVDTVGTVSQGVVTYNVTVMPDTAPDQVRAGMTASASIVTNVHQDVVLVPSTAVKTNAGGGSYVQLLVGSVPQQRTVEVGLTNDTSTEITSGLAAGDRVVTQTVDPNATQTTLRSGQGGFGGGGGFLPGGGGGRPGGG